MSLSLAAAAIHIRGGLWGRVEGATCTIVADSLIWKVHRLAVVENLPSCDVKFSRDVVRMYNDDDDADAGDSESSHPCRSLEFTLMR